MMNHLFPTTDYLYIYQQVEYDTGRYVSWFRRHLWDRTLKRRQKIVWTVKARIIFALTILLILILTFIAGNYIGFGVLGFLLVFFLSLQTSFLFLIASRFLLLIPEQIVRYAIVMQAKNKLRQHKKLIVVGITGSAGKTSTKEILYSLLAGKYNVVKTPKNYNTPLGLAGAIMKFITPSTEIFIAEMGAYRRGDITQLTNLAKPNIGILTGISPQHIETFGSIENIVLGKFELIDALPENGTAILNGDDARIVDHAKDYKVDKRFYSIKKPSDLYATDIIVNKEGTQFTLHVHDQTAEIMIPLLGKHQVANTLAAIATCFELGMTVDEIKEAIHYIVQVPHRLQILSDRNDIIVIDDTYNANTNGVLYALETLNTFAGYKKVLVTHGMVELGEEERNAHIALGKKAGEVCDWILLVGKHRGEMMLEGVKQTSFDLGKVLLVENADIANSYLPKILTPKTVVLFQNDLPDSYL